MPRTDRHEPLSEIASALDEGDLARALPLAEAAVAKNPLDARTHTLLARALYLHDDALRALRAATRATELAPHEADGYAIAGAAQLALGRIRQAIDSLVHALGENPAHRAARRHLAHAYALEGRVTESFAALSPLADASDLTASDAADVIELLDHLQTLDPDARIANAAGRLRALHPEARARTPALPRIGNASTRSVLAAIGRDLTDLAKRNALDPVYGRDAEIDAMIDVLLRRQKPNPLLTGPAGVGKTALLEALAQRIARGEVPLRLRGRRMIQISVASLVAGSAFRGELEARLHALIEESRAEPGLLLAIDEIHTLVGAGGMASELDASEILKPALARGEFSLIGATTDTEYERVIARDPTLSRRFTRIAVREPDARTATTIARAVALDLAKFHRVHFDDDLAALAVTLSIAHLPSRHLPDKALDILDQGAVRAVREDRARVTADDVHATVAHLAQLPVSFVRDPVTSLAGLSTRLATNVFGQNNACSAIAQTLLLHASRNTTRPPVLLFAGPEGSGKTHTALALARMLRERDDGLVRVDLADLAESHDLARLAGAPAGYTGHDEPTALVRSLRADPACVLLFEGIDRAHERVLGAIAQWLENGALVDARGERSDLSHATVIFTLTLSTSARAGFSTDAPEATRHAAHVVSRQVRSELLARIDRVVSFVPLTADACVAIAQTRLAEARMQWLSRGWNIEIDDAVAAHLAAASLRSHDGRAVQEAVDRYVLAEAAARFAEGARSIRVKVRDGRIAVDHAITRENKRRTRV